MVGMKDDIALRTDASGNPVNRQFADVAQDEPEVHAEPGFENEVHAFNFFAYVSRSDVTWNPSVCSAVKDSLICATTEEYILPIIHGNDRVEWFVQFSDEIHWDVERPRDRRAARAGDHEGGRRRRDAGRHPPPGLLAQALDAAGVGEQRSPGCPSFMQEAAKSRYRPVNSEVPLIALSAKPHFDSEVTGHWIAIACDKLFIAGEFVDGRGARQNSSVQPARQLETRRGGRGRAGRRRSRGRRGNQGVSRPGAGSRRPTAGGCLLEAGRRDRSRTPRNWRSWNRSTPAIRSATPATLDVPRTAATFRYFGGMADKLQGRLIPVEPGFLNYVTREPLGVVGQIVPWNFPLMFTSWKMGPALAAGNTVVLKPAELTPLTLAQVAELMREVGVPPGVVNIVPGFGNDRRPVPRRASAGREDRVHRIDCDRAQDRAGVVGQPQAGPARARRQGRQYRVRRRRPRRGASTAPRSRSFTTRARPVSRARACCCTKRSPTSSSRDSSRSRRRSASAIRSIRRPRWGR